MPLARPWRYLIALSAPVVVGACADLVGIGALPGEPDAGDGSADGNLDAQREGGGSDGGTHREGAASNVTLELNPTGVHLLRGTKATVRVGVTRTGTASAIDVTVSGLPAGVTASPLTIPAEAASGALTLTSSVGATLGKAAVSVKGSGASAPLDLVVAGPTGTLDSTFGGGGGILTVGPPHGIANAVAILGDGSVLVGGNLGGDTSGWALVHVFADGTVDTSYSPRLPSDGQLTSIALGPKTGPLAGTSIVAGTSTECNVFTGGPSQATVYVLQASGAPYDAFAGAGYSCTTDDAGTTGAGAAATSAGDVFLGVNRSTTGASPTLLHFASSGLPGSWSFAALSSAVTLVGLMVDPSDNAIVSGVYTTSGTTQFFALRYTPLGKGAPDPTFLGGQGNFGSPSGELYTQCSALDPDGGVFVGGDGTNTASNATLGHVNSAGRSDLGGDAGYVLDPISVQNSIGYVSIAVQSDRKVVGVGTGQDSELGPLSFVARATSQGALDTTFNADAGTAYFVTVSGTQGVVFNAVAVAPFPDGRIVIAGAVNGGMLVERIWP
jgi:hypothetical protein